MINVDPNNYDNAPTPDQLQQVGVKWVRLVSRNDPTVLAYIEACQNAGLMVLGVITAQSQGFLCPADIWQIGNEPDVPGTADSGSASQYVAYWNLYRQTYPDVTMIGAGLGSGQTSYWQAVQAAGGLAGATGFAVHPYAKTATQAAALLKAYQKITPSLPLWATEINRSPAELPGFIQMLRQTVAMWAWFCWSPTFAASVDIWPLTDSTRRILRASS